MTCRIPFSRQWCVGERTEELRRLIDIYKFQRAKAAAGPLADLLASRIGQLPPETIVVSIPTIPSHIRARGYDHAGLLARGVARRQKLRFSPLLIRATMTQQRGGNRSTRLTQAKSAFTVQGKIHPDLPYLLIDDVVTTGATMRHGALTLRSAGARTIWAGVLARQPLD